MPSMPADSFAKPAITIASFWTNWESHWRSTGSEELVVTVKTPSLSPPINKRNQWRAIPAHATPQSNAVHDITQSLALNTAANNIPHFDSLFRLAWKANSRKQKVARFSLGNWETPSSVRWQGRISAQNDQNCRQFYDVLQNNDWTKNGTIRAIFYN